MTNGPCAEAACGTDAGARDTDARAEAGRDDEGERDTDAGTSGTTDAGTSGATDAGTSGTTDAGTSGATDAGTSGTTDAGTSGATDAGTSGATDAGTSGATDAGTSGATDAGTSADAGSGANDAGSSGSNAGGADGGASNSTDAGARSGPTGLEISPHLAFGIPDSASVGNPTRWLIVRPQYVVSYDTTHKVPNWSAWKLDTSWFGPATRATSFRTDPLLPSGTAQARDSDYTNSGFDRGHLCPSADRTITDPDNDATFVLTNVVPQTHASNAGPWLTLEDEGRQLANAGKHLLIIAGPIYGATQQNIGTGVAVPISMFKVVVITSEPVAAGALNAATTKVYATIIPNVTTASGNWRQWQVSIDTIEQQTGLDFLSDVPATVQAVLESRIDP
ncbi:MAG: DNA/RNA non-specific endonuclease [Archangium sp.]|nr:DNA/RNA non-specific endonuclease [Archangium sp.]